MTQKKALDFTFVNSLMKLFVEKYKLTKLLIDFLRAPPTLHRFSHSYKGMWLFEFKIMKQLTINASARNEIGSAASRRLRHDGKVPVIAYGNSKEPTNLYVDASELRRTLKAIGNSTPIVQLAEAGGETKTSIIQDVQRHPITDKYIHVDFQQVGADDMVAISIPVHPVGECSGVKNEGGTLEFVLHTVHVRCLLKDHPEQPVFSVAK